jgi:hypothetical protein
VGIDAQDDSENRIRLVLMRKKQIFRNTMQNDVDFLMSLKEILVSLIDFESREIDWLV